MSGLSRRPEPELMMGEEQAAAYAGADFTDLNQAMVTQFHERFGRVLARRLLDLGCGSADITIRFAMAFPGLRALGVDGSEAMLRFGRHAVRAAALEDRIDLERRYLPDESLCAREFDVVTANSLLHHLRDPGVLWRTVRQCAAPGAAVMVMDLRRPKDRRAVRRLVAKYGAEAPALLRRDFFNSLCAAYTAEEIRGQLDAGGLTGFHTAEVSELHVLVWGVAT
jgi:2-polyprenyl-3-methyl-5-hydroxy-6-metoxy-1,4-benzoquinol methylase